MPQDEDAAGPRQAGAGYRAAPCPVCSKMSVGVCHPFCSTRCRDIDLHRWLGGHYAIPARDGDQDE